MSNKKLYTVYGSIILVIFLISLSATAHAMKGNASYSDSPKSSSSSFSSSSRQMMVDLSAHYVRDTKADGDTDTAARFSLGGMFNDWLGLDFQALYEARSKDYLVGGDFRLVPNDWFFLKAGMGAYADKETHAFKTTPIAGAGIIARMNRDYYFLTEGTYFQVNNRNNVTFGVGLGMYF